MEGADRRSVSIKNILTDCRYGSKISEVGSEVDGSLAVDAWLSDTVVYFSQNYRMNGCSEWMAGSHAVVGSSQKFRMSDSDSATRFCSTSS